MTCPFDIKSIAKTVGNTVLRNVDGDVSFELGVIEAALLQMHVDTLIVRDEILRNSSLEEAARWCVEHDSIEKDGLDYAEEINNLKRND